MENDYRRTAYEESAGDYSANKLEIERDIRTDHPKQTDFHRLLRQNGSLYKKAFIRAYGGKCAYCGVSIKIIGEKQFEIDHYLPYTDHKRFKTKREAGYMDNLILACYDCNRNKSDYSISDPFIFKLHPDKEGIIRCFYRDEEYYIRINPEKTAVAEIVEFYNQLRLGQEIHRLDYLLMSIKGLCEKYKERDEICSTLAKAIVLLQEKRNIE